MKKLPIIKKWISELLTKRSKEILVVWFLWGSSMLWQAQEVNAWYYYFTYNTDISPYATFYPTDGEAAASYPNPAVKTFTIVNSSTCWHVSWIVNGHLSAIPSVSVSSQQYTVSKQAINKHSNHSSWWWCF